MNRHLKHNSLVGACRDYLRANGAWELKTLGGLGQRAGVPDILACLQGRFIAVEAKTGDAQLETKQKLERAAIRQARGLYVEARCVEDLEDALVEAGLTLRGLLSTR